ncbi:cell envelope integrity protein TolA [Marinimicrobium sp. LS-A18]|uniref:cell envelope integrity protein TolA n=1 Tax=Marinimicrobium sp. LS-A18 TaxID=1381596 RepID=UPI00046429E6|nr:cell envelope integrity protein TolA [Marinimicrobium sp. LS-A18]
MTLKAYTLPLLISLSLHALVFALVFSTWDARPEPREVQRPRVVQAKVVEYTPKSQRQAEQQAAQQKVIDMRQRQQERERQEAERRRQQEEARRAQAQREREQRAKAERERQEAEQRRREREAAEQRRREQELQAERERLERQQQLDRALAEEAEFFEEQQAQEVAQSYVDVMAQRIENNWSRPPSARTGMQCVLEIQLVPTGQVVNVTVVESSGNSAFDRSAEQAVKRIDRFEEIQGMPSHVFESQFRQLRLVFKPEDLRL